MQRDAGTFSNIVQLSETLSAHAGYLGNLIPNLFAVEKFREAATILILVSVAILAEPKRTERFAVFLWIFARLGYWVLCSALDDRSLACVAHKPGRAVFHPGAVDLAGLVSDSRKHPDRCRRPADTT